MYGYDQQTSMYGTAKIDWGVQVVDPLKAIFIKVISFIPDLVTAIGIFLIGWGVAWAAMKLIKKFLETIRFDQIAQTTGVADVLDEKKIGMTQSVWISKLFYWFGIFVTLIIVLDVLRLRIPSVILDEVGFFLSMIFTGLIIFLLGLFLSMIASKFVESTSRTLKAGNPIIQAAIIRWAVIFMTFAATLAHFGFPRDLIFIALGAVGLTLCVTFAIAFGIGGVQWTPKLMDKFLK